MTSHKVSEGPTSESPEVPWQGELAPALGHTPSWKVWVTGAHCHLQPLPWGPWACGNPGLCSASTPHLTEQFQAPLTEVQRGDTRPHAAPHLEQSLGPERLPEPLRPWGKERQLERTGAGGDV